MLKATPDQKTISARCFHPAGSFIEIPNEKTEIPIPQLFEEIARQFPDKLAVSMDGSSLTYGELNRQANRIARAIVETCGDGISPVVVLADQCHQTLAALLGAFKAGKIMVALDPMFPLDRLASMADDANATAILSAGHDLHLAERLSGADRPVIDVDAIRHDISTENLVITRAPSDPARIHYTSGSTGKPKGALSNHRKDAFHCLSRINRGHICKDDRLVMLKRFSFGFTDTFSGLLAGASMFPFDVKARGLQSLGDFLRAEEITYLVATPSIFRYFAQELGDNEEFPQLRMIKLGGEPAFRTDVELYKRHFSRECILLNQLSGSEMGPICQYWVSTESEIDTPIVPVGYALEGKKVVLLGEDRQEVGASEVGEIAVTSSYLFSGYWNRSEPANEAVLSRDASTDESLYLTGDLGRMLPDGCVLYVGRRDDQIKIRGAKVEIREVEAVLSEHPQVRQSVVVAFDGGRGDKYLAGYVVPFDRSAITVTAINDYLRTKLPDYMMPSAFVFLDQLPLVNGKVDRKALPRPDERRPELSTGYTSPRNQIEGDLVRIWEDVINVRPIGVHDNFFDLGGHSLAATRIVSRVLQHFKLAIPLQSLFEAPTIALMATVITAHRGKVLDDRGVAAILAEVESISDADAEQLLAKPDHEEFQA